MAKQSDSKMMAAGRANAAAEAARIERLAAAIVAEAKAKAARAEGWEVSSDLGDCVRTLAEVADQLCQLEDGTSLRGVQ